MMNLSGIEPTEYNVLVDVHEIEDKVGSILLADDTKTRKQAMATKGTLVAVSPLAFTYETWPEGARVPQVGDTVVMTKAAGVMVEGADGKEYRLLKDKDIAAVMETNSFAMRVVDLDKDIATLNAEARNE